MRTLKLTDNFFYKKNLLSVTQFENKYMVNQLLDIANRFQNDINIGRSFDGMLKVVFFFNFIIKIILIIKFRITFYHLFFMKFQHEHFIHL